MSDDPARMDGFRPVVTSRPGRGANHMVLVSLNDEQYAAVEGWRAARGIGSQAEALGELVRIGLLAEIAKIFRFVTDRRPGAGHKGRGGKAGRAAGVVDG